MNITIPKRRIKPTAGYRCVCGNTKLARYEIFGEVKRGMKWCDPCGRVVRKNV